MVEAAIKVGVQHLITSDFSSDTSNEHVEELIVFEPEIKAQKYLEMRHERPRLHGRLLSLEPFMTGVSGSVYVQFMLSYSVRAKPMLLYKRSKN